MHNTDNHNIKRKSFAYKVLTFVWFSSEIKWNNNLVLCLFGIAESFAHSLLFIQSDEKNVASKYCCLVRDRWTSDRWTSDRWTSDWWTHPQTPPLVSVCRHIIRGSVILDTKLPPPQRMTPKNSVPRRVRPMAREKEVAPAAQHEILLYSFGDFLSRQRVVFLSKIISIFYISLLTIVDFFRNFSCCQFNM
jgi:hypothetical protein